jgi:hypothetical protein
MKPWSITTTVRNPERIRDFLTVLQDIEGEVWNDHTQERFQILLIQHKKYGAGNIQFYKGLTKEQIDLMETPDIIDFEQAEEIYRSKNYVGGAMRGRQSYNPLEKMGLAYLDANKKIRISNFGKYFLQENYDLGEVFFRSFLKWQIPNPDVDDYKFSEGYNVKPFIATLHLINEVNTICRKNGTKEKGISKLEFELFAITLLNYKNIKLQAEKLYKFRIKYEKLQTNKDKEKDGFVNSFVSKELSHIERLNNLGDYADNAIRYFRLTRYIYLRGNGYYIDLEPRRMVEINALLNSDNASAKEFDTQEQYREYICDLQQPILPWENNTELTKIAETTAEDIRNYQQLLTEREISFCKFDFLEIVKLDCNELKNYVQKLRDYRKKLQQIEVHFDAQQVDEIEKYIAEFKNIFKSKGKKPVELERLCTLALNALNDAISINPNYPVGDDNEPTFTAPANKPDIECYYKTFNAICEVTMLTNRQQWYAEGQPVMRHLRDFENNHSKETYCLFIAPNLHRDTVNTYWTAIKYEYEGVKQKIIPLTINQFVHLLDALVIRKKKGSQIYHNEMKDLFDSIIEKTNSVSNSDKWLSVISEEINNWILKLAA